jgi:hypothetical protein
MIRIVSFIATLGILQACYTPIKAQEIDMAEFLQTAVYNGLAEDTFPAQLVSLMLEQKDSLFVPNCKICENVQAGMRRYLADATGTEDERQVQNWLQSNGAEKCYNFSMDIYHYVNDEIARRKLTEAQLARLNNDLAVAKKSGMTQKHLSNIPARYCPSCEGATKR